MPPQRCSAAEEERAARLAQMSSNAEQHQGAREGRVQDAEEAAAEVGVGRTACGAGAGSVGGCWVKCKVQGAEHAGRCRTWRGLQGWVRGVRRGSWGAEHTWDPHKHQLGRGEGRCTLGCSPGRHASPGRERSRSKHTGAGTDKLLRTGNAADCFCSWAGNAAGALRTRALRERAAPVRCSTVPCACTHRRPTAPGRPYAQGGAVALTLTLTCARRAGLWPTKAGSTAPRARATRS